MEIGLTIRLPDGAPAVLKFVPVQDVASVEDQESVEERPVYIDVGLKLMMATGLGLASKHDAFVPPPEPLQIQVQEVAPSTLLMLVPEEQL